METIIKGLNAKFTELLGENQFVYGSFRSKPSTPYANYALDYSDDVYADNENYYEIGIYIFRLVTDVKDFALEKQFKDIFKEFELTYKIITDEDITSQKVHCTEFEVTICAG